jgi:hypothetical protein
MIAALKTSIATMVMNCSSDLTVVMSTFICSHIGIFLGLGTTPSTCPINDVADRQSAYHLTRCWRPMLGTMVSNVDGYSQSITVTVIDHDSSGG